MVSPAESTTTSSDTALFSRSNPYPGEFDDIQVGDRLSDVSQLQLPHGRLSRSVYSYRPNGGPFKTIYATMVLGPTEPRVTGLVYVFRNSENRAEVVRQAEEAFGQGEAVSAGKRSIRQWPHIDGVHVSIERDRYVVEQDLSAEGRRFSRRRSNAVGE
jgi:hypothetical protein